MNIRGAGVFVLALAAAACGGSDGATGANGKDGANGAAGSAGADGSNGSNGTNGSAGAKGADGTGFDAGPVPSHAPGAITFSDLDPNPAVTDGIVHIAHAADESDVTSYVVYWGVDTTKKLYLTPLFEVPANGSDVFHPLKAPTPLGGGGTLLAFSKNAAGEMATGSSVALGSGGLVDVDISAGQGTNSGFEPAIALDEGNQKVLVVTRNVADSSLPALYRCNYDGTGCTFTEIAGGAGSSSGYQPAVTVDTTNGKLLVATYDQSNSGKPTLIRCNLDGTSCTHTDISAGQGTGSGQFPSITLDSASAKIDVVTTNNANNLKPSLFRCNLDGTSCTHTDLSTGQGNGSGAYPSAAVDSGGAHLLVATTNLANSGKPSLFVCALDGSNCVHHDISTRAGNASGYNPSIAVDIIQGHVNVVAQNGTTGGALLFHCNDDGSACERSDPFQGGLATGPSSGFDLLNRKIVSVAAGSLGINVSRCDAEGLNCSNATSDGLTTPRLTTTQQGRFWVASTASDTGHPMLTFIQ